MTLGARPGVKASPPRVFIHLSAGTGQLWHGHDGFLSTRAVSSARRAPNHSNGQTHETAGSPVAQTPRPVQDTMPGRQRTLLAMRPTNRLQRTTQHAASLRDRPRPPSIRPSRARLGTIQLQTIPRVMQPPPRPQTTPREVGAGDMVTTPANNPANPRSPSGSYPPIRPPSLITPANPQQVRLGNDLTCDNAEEFLFALVGGVSIPTRVKRGAWRAAGSFGQWK
jgi:hypothetical protein